MKILGLDLSTHLGYAVLDSDHGLGAYEVKHARETIRTNHLEGLCEDFHFLHIATEIGKFVKVLVDYHKPDFIFIEQTNLGNSRTDQKLLEFIHFATLNSIKSIGAEEKVNYVDSSTWRSGLGIKMSKDQRVHNKEVKSGTARGKITPKHLAVAWVNSKHNLKLLLKDNDIADAICLAEFGLMRQSQPKPKQIDVEKLFDNS